MGNRINKISKVIIIIAGLIFLLGTGLLIFINTSSGQNFLKNVIAAQLENNLKVKIDIGSLETNLISYFNADRLTVKVNNQNDEKPLLSIAKLRVDYSIYDLLFGQKNLNNLLLDSVIVNLHRDSLGNFILPSFPEETNDKDSAFTLPVNIISGEIKNINIFYADNHIPLNVYCSNLRMIIRKGSNRNGHNFKTSIDSLKLDYFDKPITINNLITSGFIKENLDAEIDSFYANVSGLKLNGKFSKEVNTLTGNINIIGNPKNIFEVTGGNSLAEFSGSKLNAELNLAVINFSSPPELSFNLNFPNYNVNGISIQDFNLNGKWFSDTLYLSDLSFKSLNGSVSSSGLLVFDSLFNHHFYLKAVTLS